MPKRPKVIYRRCQECTVVRPAAEFKRAPGAGRFGGPVYLRCQECGHVGLRADFAVVEPPAEGEGGGDVKRPEPPGKQP